MPEPMQQNICEAVGVFHSPENLDNAIAELEGTHFSRIDISVLGGSKKVEEIFGTESVETKELQDNSDAPRAISIRPEEKTIGASVIIGSLAYLCGTYAVIEFGMDTGWSLVWPLFLGSTIGATIGILVVYFIGRKIKENNFKRLRDGGLLLWVRTPQPGREIIAKNIMLKNGGRNVHVHNIRRSS